MVNAVVTRLISSLFKVGVAETGVFHADPKDIKLSIPVTFSY